MEIPEKGGRHRASDQHPPTNDLKDAAAGLTGLDLCGWERYWISEGPYNALHYEGRKKKFNGLVSPIVPEEGSCVCLPCRPNLRAGPVRLQPTGSLSGLQTVGPKGKQHR
jgi:hypothetical protein